MRRFHAGALGAGLVLAGTRVSADHPGPGGAAHASPWQIGLLWGGIALAAGLLLVVIVMLLARHRPE